MNGSSDRQGSEQNHDFYDNQFIGEERWKKHYSETGYYPLWSVIVDRLINNSIQSVLDVGCGSGQMARLLHDKNIKNYVGFDFSKPRIEYAKIICPTFTFFTDDAFTTNFLLKSTIRL